MTHTKTNAPFIVLYFNRCASILWINVFEVEKNNSQLGPLIVIIVVLLLASHIVFSQLVESNVLCLVNEELKATVWCKQKVVFLFQRPVSLLFEILRSNTLNCATHS